MFQVLYIEEEIQDHPRTLLLKKRFAHLPHISCGHYGEVFNRKGQNFRLQKEKFSLILAKKKGNLLLETPQGYGLGGVHNYYFSHMLNCPFDCRYCFLQGMYASAHIVLFVNFEDFAEAIAQKKSGWFFSGYDCDSLALEKISNFASTFLTYFAKWPNAFLELRTKSVNIDPLLLSSPIDNVVTAFSLNPESIIKRYEHRTPSLHSRLNAMAKLQSLGWKIGIRFDPIIYCENFQGIYKEFFQTVFAKIAPSSIHSVTWGPFRLPPHFYKNIVSLHPEEKLFSLGKREKIMCYPSNIEEDLLHFCEKEILHYLPKELVFPCIEKKSLLQDQAAVLAMPSV